MFSPVPYDNGQRPVRVFDPVRITLLPTTAVAVALGWVMAFIFAEAVIAGQLLAEGWTAAAWARFLIPQVLVLPFFLRTARRSIAHFAYRVTLEDETMEIAAPKSKPIRIAYDEIDKLSILRDSEDWFRVKPLDRDEIVVPKGGVFLRKHHREEMVRIVGSRLRADARLERWEPPDEEQEIDRLYWVNLYDPPPVSMEPGKRYRYIAKASALTHLTDRGFGTLLLPVGFSASWIVGTMRRGDWSVFEILLYLLFALALIPLAAYTKTCWRTDDLFEWAPDGLWVVRRGRRFKVTNPQPVYPPYSCLSPVKRPILRYGRGWNAFYFDPRFIEEDVPEPWAEEDP